MYENIIDALRRGDYELVYMAPEALDGTMRGVVRQSPISLLVVEQYVARALELADYVYILDRGRLTYVAEPSEISELNELSMNLKWRSESSRIAPSFS